MEGDEANGVFKSPTFINVAFLGNRANIRGGAISADAFCHFECSHCVFDSNSCAKKGGAIYLDFDSDPVFKKSVFRNNYVKYLFIFVMVSLMFFTQNHQTTKALEAGGCIAADGQSKAILMETTFDSNSAGWEGGCLYSGMFYF